MSGSLSAYARFLTAQWDEIEAAATAVVVARPEVGSSPGAEAVARLPEPLRTHVMLHGPYDVLADVAAKRSILAQVLDGPAMLAHGQSEPDAPWFLVALAEPFAAHPDHPGPGEPPTS